MHLAGTFVSQSPAQVRAFPRHEKAPRIGLSYSLVCNFAAQKQMPTHNTEIINYWDLCYVQS